MMNKAYIALGSNIPPRFNYLKQAIEAIHELDQVSVINQSAIYETEPVGYKDQNKFLNQVIEVNTRKTALELLELCQSIENRLGRKRSVRWGPRTIDLDILLYEQEIIEMDQLLIPHPRMTQRAFVLIPLMELAPNLTLPIINKTVSEQLDSLSNDEKRGVVKWIKQDGEEE